MLNPCVIHKLKHHVSSGRSLHASRSSDGTSPQERKSSGSDARLKASRGTRVTPLLSQITRDRECVCSSCLCFGENTPGCSHQNLKHQKYQQLESCDASYQFDKHKSNHFLIQYFCLVFQCIIVIISLKLIEESFCPIHSKESVHKQLLWTDSVKKTQSFVVSIHLNV